jgi:hypothetical protein
MPFASSYCLRDIEIYVVVLPKNQNFTIHDLGDLIKQFKSVSTGGEETIFCPSCILVENQASAARLVLKQAHAS